MYWIIKVTMNDKTPWANMQSMYFPVKSYSNLFDLKWKKRKIVLPSNLRFWCSFWVCFKVAYFETVFSFFFIEIKKKNLFILLILPGRILCSSFGDEKKDEKPWFQINSPLFEHLYEHTAFLNSHLKFYAPIISNSFD